MHMHNAVALHEVQAALGLYFLKAQKNISPPLIAWNGIHIHVINIVLLIGIHTPFNHLIPFGFISREIYNRIGLLFNFLFTSAYVSFTWITLSPFANLDLSLSGFQSKTLSHNLDRFPPSTLIIQNWLKSVTLKMVWVRLYTHSLNDIVT